jgi:hypothetical protein
MKDFFHNLEAHIDDIVKVNFVGLTAFAVSWTEMDHALRTLGLIAALVYTCTKIVQALKDLKK